MADDKPINLDYRPASYFWPMSLATHLLTTVSGVERRAALERLIAEGRAEEAPQYLATSNLPDDERKAVGAVHPIFMGGEYLAKKDEGEVEIARIEIASTTYDVTSVFAKKVDGVIRYRVVDEYGGDTLSGDNETESKLPLTLDELERFFMGSWSLYEVLEMNFFDETESMLGFFVAKSEFYPDLDRLLRERVVEQFPLREGDGEEEQ
jgi:hypothetical protein